MIACLRWWRRAPGLDDEAFREAVAKWLSHPAPMPGVASRRVWVARERIHRVPSFDALERIAWHPAAAPLADLEEAAAGAPFETRPEAVAALSERRLAPGPADGSPLLIEVAALEDVARSLVSRRLARDHWPELLDHAPDLRGALLRELFAIRPWPLPAAALLELHASGTGGIPPLARRLEAAGYRVSAVRAEVFDSAPGPEAGPAPTSGVETSSELRR